MAMKTKSPAVRKRPDQDQLALQALSPETLEEREKKLKAVIESAKKIHQDCPEISIQEVTRLLNPLARKSYTLQETAVMLGISYLSVYRLVQRGKLKVLNVLRHKLVPASEIEAFLTRP